MISSTFTRAKTRVSSDLKREAVPISLSELALAGIAACVLDEDASLGEEASILQKALQKIEQRETSFINLLLDIIREPDSQDVLLVKLSKQLDLTPLEILVTGITTSVEANPLIGSILSYVQSPLGGSRPTVGLLIKMIERVIGKDIAVVPQLLKGRAMATGLLRIKDDEVPLPEQTVVAPLPTCMALWGYDSPWTGTTIAHDKRLNIPVCDATIAEATRHAHALQNNEQTTLLIRSDSEKERRTVAEIIATQLNMRPVYIESEHVNGMAPWLWLRQLLPVFCLDLSPGTLHQIPIIPGYEGPILGICGPDGSAEYKGGAVINWYLKVPSLEERTRLWRAELGESTLATRLGKEFRHSAGRIAYLGKIARHYASLHNREELVSDDILQASWGGESGGLDSLAHPFSARISDEALVASPIVKEHLEHIVIRCRQRDRLVGGLGVSTTTRYKPGLTALFTGPSGTGKTLAAGWVATQLDLPLYKVDLASITSKYIGETEKNLAQLLARAEHAEVILLFDEADSLFGKRTEVNDSNDRYANAQTNYLLQRIEHYEGIVLLTSNSLSRFDTAFMRRLDYTVSFPNPGLQERKALWIAHLGEQACITPGQINQLAALLDLNGGHIRNAVLSAAVHALNDERPIEFFDVIKGVKAELKKLGKQVPAELSTLARGQ